MEYKVGSLLYAQILGAYVAIVSVGALLIAVSIANAGNWQSVVVIFLALVGVSIFYAVFKIGGEELETQRRLIETRIERERVQVQAEKQDLEPQAIGKITHTLRLERAIGDDTETTMHELGTNIPSELFISVCYEQSKLSPSRRVPERKIFGLGEFPQADVWFDALERVGILKTEGGNPNSPRRWNDDFTLDQARQAFGYGKLPQELVR